MKNILFKAFEEDGRHTYVYELPEEVELDEDTLDMCEAASLTGVVPMEYVDDADAFYYDVTGYKTLAKALSTEVDAADVLEALYGLAKVLVEFKENGIPLSYLLLHKDFIFIDRMTMEVKFICIPLEDGSASNAMEDVAHFIRVLLATLRYDISEDGSYITKLITLANTIDQFNVSIFVNVLQDLMNEYGVAYDEIAEADSYIEYEGEDIATIDASALEDMPETVSVADMEAEAIRQESMEAEEKEAVTDEEQNAFEKVPEADMEDEDTLDEPVETEAEDALGETVETEAEDALDETTEAEAEDVLNETVDAESEDAVDAEDIEDAVSVVDDMTEEPEVEDDEDVEPETAADTSDSEDIIEEEPVQPSGPRQSTEGRRTPGKAAAKDSIIWDDETKKKQQEALRKIAEAEKLAQYGKKSLNLDIDEPEEAEAEEEEYGNTQALPPKEKPHKLELARETIVRPVFDSVFEPIIESIDGPIDDDTVAHAAEVQAAPAKPARKSKVKLAPPKMEFDDEEEVGNSSILSKTVTPASEPSLLSQLDSRADNLPKVNPYLIRVNNEERIMITKTNFKIGKASFGMDYQVTDNGAISRNHCTIIAKDGVYYIRDNKSTNHTYVNGQMVKSGQEVLLTHESTIRIADEDFLFKLR